MGYWWVVLQFKVWKKKETPIFLNTQHFMIVTGMNIQKKDSEHYNLEVM